MGNLGGGEILVLLVVGLLVLGPERLPEATRQVGKALRHIRRVTTGFQEELRAAVEDPVIETKARLSGEALLRESGIGDLGATAPASGRQAGETDDGSERRPDGSSAGQPEESSEEDTAGQPEESAEEDTAGERVDGD